MKTIKREISKGRQDVSYVEILTLADYKIKVSICSDAYDFQSYARIYVWKDLAWSLIDTIRYSEMSTKPGLVYSPKTIDPSYFLHDRDSLIEIAEKILETGSHAIKGK